MSFKSGQKVRIKGTDIEGTIGLTEELGIANVEVRGGGPYRDLLKDYYVPAELVEAVVEPITVTFDPVELPGKVPTWFGQIEFAPARGFLTVGFVDNDGGPNIRGKNIDYADARKLALAILTVTDGSRS